jgi:hypothetical protein
VVYVEVRPRPTNPKTTTQSHLKRHSSALVYGWICSCYPSYEPVRERTVPPRGRDVPICVSGAALHEFSITVLLSPYAGSGHANVNTSSNDGEPRGAPQAKGGRATHVRMCRCLATCTRALRNSFSLQPWKRKDIQRKSSASQQHFLIRLFQESLVRTYCAL